MIFTAGGGTSYEFFLNGGSVQGPGALNTYTTSVLADGDVVSVTVTDGNGCEDTHAGITTTVNPLPTATLSSSDGDDEICLGESVIFTAGGGTSYEFFLNGGSVQGPGALNTYTTSVLADGDVVSVTVTDGNGCEDTHAGITTTVNPLPTATLSSSDGGWDLFRRECDLYRGRRHEL